VNLEKRLELKQEGDREEGVRQEEIKRREEEKRRQEEERRRQEEERRRQEEEKRRQEEEKRRQEEERRRQEQEIKRKEEREKRRDQEGQYTAQQQQRLAGWLAQQQLEAKRFLPSFLPPPFFSPSISPFFPFPSFVSFSCTSPCIVLKSLF
jgi:hypothetical protein